MAPVLGDIRFQTRSFYGGRLDAFIMRVIDVLLAFPGILLALAIVSVLTPGLTNVMIAVGLSAVPPTRG